MPESLRTITEPARQVPVAAEVDVLVCGGGPAGVGAALASARHGASVLVIENQICLGGNGTSGMLNRFGPYHDQRDIILGGIPWEILKKLMDRGMAQPPTPCSPKNWQDYWLVFDPEALKLLLDELVAESGVEVLFNARATAVLKEGDRVTGAVIESKSGRQAVLAKVVIDCTGDGDLAAWAGVPFDMGREEDGLVQPTTLMSKALNQDWPTSYAYAKEHRARLLAAAKDEEGIDFVWPGTDNWLHAEETYYNCVHVHRVDATNARDMTRAAIEHRRIIWKNLAVLRRHVPGCEKASLITTAAYLGVRETRRIQGDYQLNIGDVLDARQFPDQVFRYACFVDIHQVDPAGRHSAHADKELKPGTSYGVPYRCLVPRGVENLLVAGRCFSTTHEALASVRMMPACMAMGQAAGTAAAQAIRAGRTPRQVDVPQLRQQLAADGVIL